MIRNRFKNLVMFVKAMGRSMENDPLMKYKYTISIPGVDAGIGFQKISGLKSEMNVVEYNEGGFNATHKLMGRQKVDALTCERGVFANTDLETVYRSAIDNPDFRTTITITLQDRWGRSKRTWKLAEAWISGWEGPELDSSSDDVAIEKLTIQFEYYM